MKLVRELMNEEFSREPAAFRRLCVETLAVLAICENQQIQPPSGGCVLKLLLLDFGD